jgi:hypothetical protein
MLIVNRNTTQSPMTRTGRTGAQSIRCIPAPRVYIGPPDYLDTPNVVFGFSNGNSPIGFVDVGVVSGAATVALNRSLNEIFCGVDKILSNVYSQSTKASISFTLSQLDDVALETAAGVVPAFSGAGYVNYQIGQPNITPAGLLLVSQNKLDGKEWQFYNPAALLTVSFDNNSDAMEIKVSAILPSFKPIAGADSQVLSVSVLSGNIPGYGLMGYGASYGE